MELASIELLLSAQRALVGQISPKVHGVCVREQQKQIVMTFYVAPDLSDDERDDLTTAGAMVIADYPDEDRYHEEFRVAVPHGDPLPTEGTWVLRHSGCLTVER
jgi:hypothetical protein